MAGTKTVRDQALLGKVLDSLRELGLDWDAGNIQFDKDNVCQLCGDFDEGRSHHCWDTPQAPVPDTIFVLTCLSLQTEFDPLRKLHPVTHQRTWGWFKSLDMAQEAVRTGNLLYECGSYNAVVIEEVQWGSMAMTVAEHWFQVDDLGGSPRDYAVKPMPKPNALKDIVNFGMG